MAQDNIKNLYDALKGEYDLGSEEEFRKSLEDAGNRRNLYEAISGSYDVGSEEDFNGSLGYGAGGSGSGGRGQAGSHARQVVEEYDRSAGGPGSPGGSGLSGGERMELGAWASGLGRDAARGVQRALRGLEVAEARAKHPLRVRRENVGVGADPVRVGESPNVVKVDGGYATEGGNVYGSRAEADLEQNRIDAARWEEEQRRREEEAKVEHDPTLWETATKSAGAGLMRAGAGLLDAMQALTGGLIVEDASSPTGYTKTRSYEEALADKDDPMTAATSSMHGTADRLSEEAQPHGGRKGFLDMLWDGEIGGFLQKGVAVAGESLPMTLSAYNPYTMTLNAISMAGSNYRENTLANPDIPAWKRAGQAIGSAAIEQAVEKYADPIFKYVGGGKVLKGASKGASGKISTEVTKDATETLAKRIYGRLKGLGKDALGEGAEEVVSNLGNDILGETLDFVDGNEDYGLRAQWEEMKKENPGAGLADFSMAKAKEYVESFIGGAMAGAYTSGTAQLSAKALQYSFDKLGGGLAEGNEGQPLNPINVDIAQSYDDGYSEEEPTALQDAKNLYELRQSQMAEKLGVETEQVDDAIGDPVNFIGELQRLERNDEIQPVLDYINAKAKFDGMIQRVRDDIDGRIEQSNKMVNERTNHETGMIQGATLKVQDTDGNDRRAYILSGNLVMLPDGTGVDREKSGNSILILHEDTNEMEMVSPDAIFSIEQPVAPEMEKQTAAEAIRQQFAQEAANRIDGTVAFQPGDTYTVTDESGQPAQIQIVPNADGLVDNGDGTVNVSSDGGQTVVPMRKEDIQAMVDATNRARVAQVEQQREAMQQPQVQEQPTYSLNDEVTLLDENGNEVRGSIESNINEDGQYEVYTESPINGRKVNLFTAEELNRLQANPAGNSRQNGGIFTENGGNSAENFEQEQPAQSEQPVQSALERIPKDEKGQPIYEQADPDTAWDALLEQTNGDEVTAQEVANDMVADKEAALKKLEKQKPKSGTTPAEKIAARLEQKRIIEQAQADLNQWQKIAQTSQRRRQAAMAEQSRQAAEAARLRREQEEQERAAREEAERIRREALNGVPDFVDDTPQDARARGYRRVNGNKVDRQAPLATRQGKEVQVKFDDKNIPTGHVALIEAGQLQPSHMGGQRNPLHFIDEAQPKERNDDASVMSARRIAANIRPEEITSSVTAYTGAPTVNTRGEVIQGNNRSAALREMWAGEPGQAAIYKQYLADHAADFGLAPEDVEAMQQPVLVNMLDVPDEDAITLGQFVAQDTESGGTERIKPKNIVQKMGDDMGSFAGRLLASPDEEMTFSELVDRNGMNALKWMQAKNYITPTQYRSAFDSKGNLTAEAKNDLKGVMYQSIFQNGSTHLEEMFNSMPAKAQKAILATAYRDYDSPNAERLNTELQNSISAYYALSQNPDFANAKNYKEAAMAVEAWKRQYAFDDVTGESYLPSERYSNFALLLATMYKGQTQTFIQNTFNHIYDLVQGTQEATLFEEPDNTPRTLVEAINETLSGLSEELLLNGNFIYNGQRRNNVLAGSGTTGQPRGQGSPGSSQTGGRIEDGTETSNSSDRAANDKSGGRSERNGGENQGTEKEEPAKGQLTKAEAAEIIADMEEHAEVAPEIELTIENWDALFGEDGRVNTPLGEVKMGENQFTKLMRQGRNGKLGMVKPTLENPDIIIEDESQARDGDNTERPSSYVFVKTFLKGDGSRYYYFTSITVSKEGREVVVSSQEKSRNRILRLMLEGSVIWRTPKDATTSSAEKQGLDYAHPNEAEDATKGSGITPQSTSSAHKDTEKSAVTQTIGEKVAQAEAETEQNPTEAQKEAGNYKKGHVRIGQFDITVENPKGSVRRGTDASGKAWERTMRNTYGYIRGTEGVDGDHIDVFLTNDIDGWNGRRVYVVDQYNEDGTFDEHKVMLGFNDEAEAQEAYLSNYEKGWASKRKLVLSSANLEDFERWINSSHRKTKPFAEYKSVNKTNVANRADGPNAPEAEFEITPAQYTTKRGKVLDMHLVKFDKPLTKEQQRAAKELAKAEKGWYDRDKDGFMMRSEESARKLADTITENEEAVSDAQPLSIADTRKLEEPEAIGTGAFGNIYDQFRGKAKEAIAFLRRKKSGEALGALHHDEIGDIDLVWGKEGTGHSNGFGLAKLVKFHPEVLDNLQEILDDMRVVNRSDNRINLESDTHKAAVRLEWDGKRKNWLLTAFEKENSVRDNTTDTGTSQKGYGNDTATPENTVLGAKDSEKSSDKQKNIEISNNSGQFGLVSDERMEELKKRLKQKVLGQMNMGIDPEVLAIGMELTAGYIDRGIKKFADYAKVMIDDMGDVIRPYLKAFYNGARDLPEVQETGLADEMTPYDEVRTFDVANFDKPSINSLDTAKMVVQEQEADRQADEAKGKLKSQRNTQRRKEESREKNKPNVRKKEGKSVTLQQEQPDLFGGLFEENASSEATESQGNELNRKFAMAVKDDMLAALVNGTKPYRSILDLRKRASGLGMEVDDDGRTDILLQELVEDGLVRAAREVAERHGSDSRDAYDLVCKLYEMQPTIAARSSNRIKMQQYSTPLPMAWNADRFAMTGKKDVKVLEPTAGNGMLVFAIPAGQVHANELDETRLENLREQGFAQVTRQDATEPFEGGKQYDVVIANPPFGKREAVDYDGKPISGLDPQITLNALASMKDDGKAAIIIGGNMEYGNNGGLKSMKPFFTYLYDHYNVKGVVDMDGKLYAKQGTTYPTRMILIDGRRSDEERAQTAVYPPVESKAMRRAESFDELYDIINEVINSNEKTNGTEILRERLSARPVTDKSRRDADQRGRGEEPAEGNRPVERLRGGLDSRPEDVLGEQGGNDTGNGREPAGGRGRDRELGGHPDQRMGMEGRPSPVSAQRGGSETRTGSLGQGGRGVYGRGTGQLDPQLHPDGNTGDGSRSVLKEEAKRQLDTEKLPYRPHNSAFSLGSVAPAAMVEAMDNVLSQIEAENGNIDEFVRKELGYGTIEETHQALAAEQVDSVAMAIYQMKKGQALIIGDQTGVGKGRQMAALIRWAVKRGEKPIFITQKADLFSDIYRDLVDIGSGDLVPFIFNDPSAKENKGEMVDSNGKVVYKGLTKSKMQKVLATGKLPDEYDYAVLTYSQVNTGDEISRKEANEAAKKSGKRGKKSKDDSKITPKAPFLRAIAKDNYLFLDESHTAAGDGQTGSFMQSILRDVKAATFASATFAKRPDTMPLYAIRTAMSQAKVEPDKLIGIIEKGGVTLQEIMSRELTNAGQMVRRERDMSDVVTDWKTINDPATVRRARENYDRTIAAFNAIIKFQEDYVKPKIAEQDKDLAIYAESIGVKRGTNKLGVENVPFASKTYNYTKQLMLALKVDAIVDEVEAEIKTGRHPVIALESTMESSIDEYPAGEIIEEPTFGANLLKGLATVMQYTVKDENGKETHAYYSPHQLGEAGEKAYYELKDFIRKSTSDIFISPLDAIIERLHEKGYKVGELTGRNMYVERNDKGQVVVKRRTDKDKKKMQREFNNGTLDVLILNKSASTGISLHASEKFSDQRQRTMIIAQPLSDINDYMQMIGRIDRTGQVHRGYYINLGLPVPAENRFLMMLSTKLKSLNANTTTSQDSKSNEVEAPDLLNKYGSQVIVEYLRDNPEIYEKMGCPLKKGGVGKEYVKPNELDDYKPQEDDARKITGYVALLMTKEQEEFYDDVVRRYNELIKYLDDTGSNDLKITVMPLRAKTLEKRISSEGIDPNGKNPFAQNAYVEKVEMDVLRKPMKADEIRKTIEQINGKYPEIHLQGIVETIQKEHNDKIAAEEQRYENAKAKAVDSIAKQTEKINRQQKRTAEEKREAIASITQEINESVEERHNENLRRLETNKDQLIRQLRMFSTSSSYLVPDNLETMMFDFAAPAIFCGYKAKDKKITASTTLAVFATLDGRRRIEVKLSDTPALQSIYKMTNDNWDAARSITLENWDSQIPNETRKQGYILTGNILQAIADTQDEHGSYTGQLISYTDIDGNIHDGILMPDKWNTSMLKSAGAPLSARMEEIRQYKPIVSLDGKVSLVGSEWAEMYYLTVPKTKKDGAVYYENETLLKAANGIFYPFHGELRADIPAKNIGEVVRELTKLGVKVKENNDVVADKDVLYRIDDSVNERFNEQLDSLTEKNADSVTLSLGRPSAILRAAGVEDKPMKLYGNKVMKKVRKHGFTLDELHDLPQAVADPIAVFKNYGKDGNRSILTELKTEQGNFLVTLTLGEGHDVDFNIVTSVFGKGESNIIDWIKRGFATYINKEKALNYLHHSALKAVTSDNQELISSAKVVRNFENPSVEKENLRDGNGALTDDDLSVANDPVSKLLGKSTRTAAQRRAFAERERQRMTQRVQELAEKLHLDNVDIVTDASTLQGRRAKAKGFYSRSTVRITIVIPNHANVYDAEQTLLHEAVAHYGLRELFGEHFDTFLDNVFQSADENVCRHIVELAEKRNWDFRTATEEYLASLAEDTNFENINASWWQKIKELFLRMLHKIGFENFSGVSLSDNELRYILWRSYENLAEPGRYRSILGEAEDVAKQYGLKVGNYSTDNNGTSRNVAERDELYRDGDPEVHERVLARDLYEQRVRRGMYQMQEALQDSMLGLREAMEAILKGEGKKKVRIEDVDGFENAYLGENRLSSVNKAEADAFAHTLFKPLLDEVGKLAPNKEAREELTDYMMAKHGLERNRVMREREKEKLIASSELAKSKPEQPSVDDDDFDLKMDAYNKAIEEWENQVEEGLGDKFEAIDKRDFAGLTALTETDNVADAETEAEAMVDTYESEHDTEALWKRTNDVSNAILSKLYETGMMSKETYDNVRSMYEYYIPLRGFDEKTSDEAYAYLNSKNSAFNAPIKKAKGRKSKADDPLAYLQSMAESAITQGNRNKLVKQKFLNFVLNHPSDLASVSDIWLKYDKVADEWQPVFPDNINADDTPEEVERKMQDFEDKMKELAEQDPDLYKHGKDTVNIPYRVVEKRDLRQHQIVVKRGGRDYVITINGNPRAAQALNGQTNPDNDMSGAAGAILKAGERINRELSALYTTRNPDFVVSNFIRDMLYSNSMMWVKESPNYALRYHRNFAKVNPVRMKMLLAKHRNGTLDMNNETERLFHQFMMNGGETGYANMRDIEKHKNDIRREIRKAGGQLPIRRAWDLLTERLDEVNRGVENCARFAAFMTSREMGRTIDRSIYDAKEISVNFNKKGSGAKFIGATGQTKLGNASAFMSGLGRSGFVFWNAAIQGTANFGRQTKRHPAKALTGLAAMFLLGAIVASLGYGDDDEDDKNSYWNLPKYVRRSNLLFRAGDQWISIPLPVEYRAVYGLGELMVSTMSGKEHLTDGEIANAIAGQVSQLLPLDFLEGGGGMKAFIPSSIKPFAEASLNTSWTGLPIYKDTPYNKDMPEWTKAYKSANKYLVDLSETLNEISGGDEYKKGWVDKIVLPISRDIKFKLNNPAQWEYVLNGYFGGISNTIDRLTKMGETIIGQREYDPNSFLVLNRILKNGDERTEQKAVNNEYFKLQKEYENTKRLLRNYERDTDNGIFDYAEKIDFLYNSPEYERYEIFESYRPDIDDLYNMLKEANSYGDKDEIKDIEAQLNELKKMMISDMNKTRK